jgi:hypothetical protein
MIGDELHSNMTPELIDEAIDKIRRDSTAAPK